MQAFVITYDGMGEPIKIPVEKLKRAQLTKNQITMVCENCGRHEDITFYEYEKLLDKEIVDCSECRVELNTKRHMVPFGISKFFRQSIKPWIEDSLKHHNNTCMITGQPANVIHHIKAFSGIVIEVLEEFKMSFDDCYNCDSETDEKLFKKCLELHYKYGYGACLTREIHQLFHHCYGNIANNEEQFKEFQERIKAGKIDVNAWLQRYNE